MRIAKLPGWVVDEATSIRDEMAPFVGLSPEERWQHTKDCARDAMWAIRVSDVPERALRYQDPVPESTRVALERLRRRR